MTAIWFLVAIILFLAWYIMPILVIWSINVLWGADTIIYGLYTHLAVLFLYSIASSLFLTSKDTK